MSVMMSFSECQKELPWILNLYFLQKEKNISVYLNKLL